MAEKCELQKTISFRLNMKREDEKALYEAIMSHNRGKTDDPYGSGGAYIKAALKSFCGNGEQLHQSDQYQFELQKMMQEQLNMQNEFMMKALGTLDSKISVLQNVKEANQISGPEEAMPEEAFSYLQNL